MSKSPSPVSPVGRSPNGLHLDAAQRPLPTGETGVVRFILFTVVKNPALFTSIFRVFENKNHLAANTRGTSVQP